LFILLLSVFSTDSLIISPTGDNVQFSETPLRLVQNMPAANWILFGVGGLALVVSSLILSHRIAGPLYRFERALDNMNSGNLGSHIELREKDEGKELAVKINEFNATLSRSIRTLRLSTSALDALMEQAESLDLPKEEKEHLASLCWSMREHNRKLREAFCIYCPKDE